LQPPSVKYPAQHFLFEGQPMPHPPQLLSPTRLVQPLPPPQQAFPLEQAGLPWQVHALLEQPSDDVGEHVFGHVVDWPQLLTTFPQAIPVQAATLSGMQHVPFD
jgi:hypothetical protein